MGTTTLGALACAVASTLLLPAGAAAVEVHSARFSDAHAEALFERSDGCLTQTAYVLAWEGRRTGTEGGLPQPPSSVLVSFRRVDRCTLADDTRVDTAPLSPQAFRIRGDLGYARLSATLGFHDRVTGETTPLELELAWRANGGLQRDTNRFRTREPDGSMWIARDELRIRDAVPSGRIWDGARDWVAGSEPVVGSIASTSMGLVTILRWAP